MYNCNTFLLDMINSFKLFFHIFIFEFISFQSICLRSLSNFFCFSAIFSNVVTIINVIAIIIIIVITVIINIVTII